LANTVTVPFEALAVANAPESLLMAEARLDAMLVVVVAEPDQVRLYPRPKIVMVVVPES